MLRPRWLRRSEAPLLFETFLVAAVSSFLGIRALLALTNYPQLGGNGLHIAHMLWGGLLMLLALLLVIGFLDGSVLHGAAAIAGLGFGTFIDEIGKFVTADNDYFFRPAVALVYIAFIAAFLVARAFVGNRHLDGRESLANALNVLADGFDGPIDPRRRSAIEALLESADPGSSLAPLLARYVEGLPTRAESTDVLDRARLRLEAAYDRLLDQPWFERAMTVGFLAYTVAAVAGVATLILARESLGPSGPSISTLAQGFSTLAGAALVIVGVVRLPVSWADAFRWFQRGILVWILVTQVFVFYSSELAGLGGLAIDLVAYGSLRFALAREEALGRRAVAD
jgi:hypothetical protein